MRKPVSGLDELETLLGEELGDFERVPGQALIMEVTTEHFEGLTWLGPLASADAPFVVGGV